MTPRSVEKLIGGHTGRVEVTMSTGEAVRVETGGDLFIGDTYLMIGPGPG